MRQLQINKGVAVSEWSGSGDGPIPPDASWVFVDVTERPHARLGMIYDAGRDVFSDALVVASEPPVTLADIMAEIKKLQK